VDTARLLGARLIRRRHESKEILSRIAMDSVHYPVYDTRTDSHDVSKRIK